MEIEFLGGNCFRLKTKKTTIVVDDNLAQLGAASVQSDKTVALYSSPDLRGQEAAVSRLVLDGPGEFEVGDVTVTGVQARAHMDEEGVQTATVFQFMYDGQTLSVLGHVHPDMPAEVQELVAGTDVLVVPVGGNGYTLDPAGAAGVIKKIEPGVIIPAQYEIKGLNYEVPAQPVEEFLKIVAAGSEAVEPQDSYKVGKTGEEGGSQTAVVMLKRLEK